MQTERLVLREPEEADAEALRDYYRRNAVRFAPWEPPRPDDVDGHRAWIASARASRRTGHPTAFLAFDRAGGALVAVVDLHGHSADADGEAMMIAYTVDGAYEGRGYAGEAVGAVLRHAAEVLKLKKVTAYYDVGNERSGRLLARSGFRIAATTAVVPGFERFMRAQHLAELRF